MKFKGREFWKAKAGKKTYYICNIFHDHDLAEKSIKAYLHNPVISQVGYVVGNQLTIVKEIGEFPNVDVDYHAVWVFSRR